jgi:hypothetical protein
MEANSLAPTLRDVNKSTAVLLWLCKLPISRRTQIPSPASPGVVNYSLIACILSLQRTGKSRTVLYTTYSGRQPGTQRGETNKHRADARLICERRCVFCNVYENPQHLCVSRRFAGCPSTHFPHYNAGWNSNGPGFRPEISAIERHLRDFNCIPYSCYQ